MSQTAITLAFEQWKASQAVTGEPVLLDEFVFANVPGLDASKPIDRSETLPPAAQIVHRQAVGRKGVVNENAVVHSVVLGAEVGDFSFNWIGLINKASNTLAMIVHAPLQQKLKTKDGQQGNVLTRSFLMEYNGAQAETGINTPAETWQIDFTARMAAMDERQRLENIDLYGAAAFLGNGYLVAKSGSQYFVTAGSGYVRGLRAQLAANQNITVAAKPVNVWLDVAWTGTLTSAWGVASKITVAANLADYVQNGVQHYVFAVASIDANGNITDLRPKGTLNEQAASDALKKHEQSRNHPDATTTAKGFTQLSSAINSVSEAVAATPKAVKAAYDLANGKYTAQDATTAQKGIVQLSSATNSTSEALAATPKAISTAVKELKDTLGSSASADVVSSMVDVTTGRVPVVGWMGLGGIRDTKIANENMASFWRDTSIVKSGITIPYDGSPTVSYFAVDGANQHAYVGRKPPGGSNISWVKLYSEFNKPTASDVDAVSASQGGMFQKEVIFNQGLNSRGRISWGDYSSSVGVSTYNAMVNVFDSSGKMRWAFGPYQNEWSVYTYNSDGSYKGNALRIDYTTHNATFGGMITPANYSNFDARYFLLSGGTITGNLEVKNNAPIITFSEADTGKKYFIVADGNGFRINEDSTAGNFVLSYAGASKQLKTMGQFVPGDWANFDARYQAKGSYTPAGQAYTKAESDARYQLKNSASRATNGWFKDASTGMVFQWGTITLPASGSRTTSAAFSFPMTFPNAALTLQTTPANAGVNNNGYLAITAGTSLSASGGTIYADSNNGESFSKTQTVRYFAVGY